MSLFETELAAALPEVFADLPTENVTWKTQTLPARVDNLNTSAAIQTGRALVPDGEFTARIRDAVFTGAERPARGQSLTVRGTAYPIMAADVRPGYPIVTLTLSA